MKRESQKVRYYMICIFPILRALTPTKRRKKKTKTEKVYFLPSKAARVMFVFSSSLSVFSFPCLGKGKHQKRGQRRREAETLEGPNPIPVRQQFKADNNCSLLHFLLRNCFSWFIFIFIPLLNIHVSQSLKFWNMKHFRQLVFSISFDLQSFSGNLQGRVSDPIYARVQKSCFTHDTKVGFDPRWRVVLCLWQV